MSTAGSAHPDTLAPALTSTLTLTSNLTLT